MSNYDRNSNYIDIPLTLERHLENYSLHPNSTERHKILWTTWCQNKRWLTHMLEYTLPSFQTYSKHDASHAEAVIHNMELILGEVRIKSLSATDTFMLLHIAYIHDIGMCITDEDKKGIIKEKGFLQAIEVASASNDSQVREFAGRILQKIHIDVNTRQSSELEVLEDCLGISLAISYFLADYRRKNHGQVSEERLNKMVLADSSLGVGFSTSEVPERIFIQIGKCAATHTIWGFDAVLNLEQKNNGYAHDYIHPRFIAVLLQIADALDIDNGRFHSLIHSFYGKLNHTSDLHFKKHQSIRQLNISDKSIFIAADCDSQDVIRLIRRECNYLEELLKNVNYYWSQIAPDGFSGCMPTLVPPMLLYNGREIPHELINAKFTLSQDKAFKLIEGTNVYGSSFPYLKEVIQNAIDATKLQVWLDYQGTKPKSEQAFSKEEDEITYLLDARIRKLFPKYPIEIALEIVAIDPISHEVVTKINYRDKSIYQKYDFGVSVRIQDHGIGISANDIMKIANVGKSHTSENESISEMPRLLIPTGKFGIGLQSIFQVTDTFTAATRTHFNENYQINFSSGSGFSEGVINTTTLENYESFPFGTQVSFVVPSSYCADRSAFRQIQVWDNPFDMNYTNQKKLKQAEELLSQMIHYVNSLFGIKMFPIVLEYKNMFSDRSCVPLNEVEEKNIRIVDITNHSASARLDNATLIDTLGWAFQIQTIKSAPYKGKLDNNAFYFFDTDTAKLYVWSARYNSFASVSGDRLYKAINFPSESNSVDGVKIYYKGMATEAVYENENYLYLVDYLDIQDAKTEKILLLNREGFTSDGKEYIVKVYNDILSIVRLAYEDIASKLCSDDDNLSAEDYLKINHFPSEKYYNPHNYRTLFSLCLLSYHALLTLSDLNTIGNHHDSPYKTLLRMLSKLFRVHNIHGLELPLQSIYNYAEKTTLLTPLPIVMSEIEDYGILSYRKKKNDRWENKLLSCIQIPIHMSDSTKEYNRQEIPVNTKDRIESVMTNLWSRLLQSAEFASASPPEDENFSRIMTEWLFRNTPTKELYTFFDPEEGRNNVERSIRIRFSRMSACVPAEIEMDDVSLFYLFEKMYRIGNCDKSISYCIPVFQNYRGLTVTPNEIFDDILSVKNSCFTKELYHTMLVPFSNLFVSQLISKYPGFLHTDDEMIKMWKDKYVPLSNLFKRWSATNFSKTMSRSFANYVKQKSQHISITKETLDNLLETIKTKRGSIDNLIKKADEHVNSENRRKNLESIMKAKYFNTIAEVCFWVKEGGIAELFAQETLPTREQWQELIDVWKSDETVPNLLDFTTENSVYITSKNTYLNLYSEMIQTFYDAAYSVVKKEFTNKAKLV